MSETCDDWIMLGDTPLTCQREPGHDGPCRNENTHWRRRASSSEEGSAPVTPADVDRAGEPRIYPCDDCGTMRSKAEGGTTFTVCEECWEKRYPKRTPALDLEAIRRRAERDRFVAVDTSQPDALELVAAWAREAVSDRAALLAEVERLRSPAPQERERALEDAIMAYICEVYPMTKDPEITRESIRGILRSGGLS